MITPDFARALTVVGIICLSGLGVYILAHFGAVLRLRFRKPIAQEEIKEATNAGILEKLASMDFEHDLTEELEEHGHLPDKKALNAFIGRHFPDAEIQELFSGAEYQDFSDRLENLTNEWRSKMQTAFSIGIYASPLFGAAPTMSGVMTLLGDLDGTSNIPLDGLMTALATTFVGCMLAGLSVVFAAWADRLVDQLENELRLTGIWVLRRYREGYTNAVEEYANAAYSENETINTRKNDEEKIKSQ